MLNSDYSFHLCPNKKWFQNLTEVHGGKVLLGKKYEFRVKGIGEIWLLLSDGTIKALTNARYVLELKRNLIYFRVLHLVGFSIKFNKGTLKVIKGTLVMLKRY